jgi:hypothetical protein
MVGPVEELVHTILPIAMEVLDVARVTTDVSQSQPQGVRRMILKVFIRKSHVFIVPIVLGIEAPSPITGNDILYR